MEKIKNLIGVIALIGVIILAIFSATGTPPTAKQVAQEVSNKLGALVGPIIPYQFFGFGGVVRYASAGTLNTASSTICSLLSPTSTSTLVSGGLQLTTGSSTALIFEMGRSTLMDATTTKIGNTIAWGNTVSFNATAMASTTDGFANVFPPNTYFNIKYGGSTGTAGATMNSLVGTCKAVWEIN